MPEPLLSRPGVPRGGVVRPMKTEAITAEVLASIRVLYRQDDSLSLWGVFYEMRRGEHGEAVQSPKDIHRAGNAHGWIWLGCPGWYGGMTPPERATVDAWLTLHENEIPTGPCEWATIEVKL